MPSLEERLQRARSEPDALESRLQEARGDVEVVEPAQQEVIPPSVPFGVVPPGAAPTTLALGGASTTPDPRAFDRAVELVDPLLQGMTFGFGDELTAAVSPATVDEVRERSARIREDQPGAALAAEVAGGLTAASRLGPAAAALPVLRNAPALARFGAGGAAAGAVAGAGTADGDIADRTAGAVQGAALGGAVGVVLPLGGKAAAAALTPLLRRVNDVSRPAINRIRQALERDDMTVQQARDELESLGVEAMIADAGGENVTALAQAAQSRVGRARNIGRQALETRQVGQTERIAETINETLGKGGEFRQTRDALIASRSQAAAPLYDAAYAVDIPNSTELQALLSRPAIRQAYDRARIIAANEGQEIPETLPAGAVPSMQVLDYIKRGLDDIIETSRDSITGQLRGDVARGVAKSRADLVQLVDDANPAYAAARAVYAGDSASIAALNQGRRLGLGLNRRGEDFDPEQIYDDLDRMSPAEQAFFRQGLARGLMDIVQMTSDTADAVKRLVGNEARRGRLRAAFPDGETFSRFMFDLNRELRFFNTRSAILSGSPTQPRQAAQEALEGTAVSNPLQGGLVESMGRGTMALVNRAARPSPELAGEIGDIMFAQGPNALRFLNAIDAAPRGLSPALERNALTALIEAERQAGTFPNR